MAEGWARHLLSGQLEPYSAGVVARGLDSRAVKAMAEAGVDISRQRSKTVSELGRQRFDIVVTLCGEAQESCPVFPGRTRVIHKGFQDPPQLALGAKTEGEALDHYRRVRDEIRRFVEELPGLLGEPEGEDGERKKTSQRGPGPY
jgi:arsenate reductase